MTGRGKRAVAHSQPMTATPVWLTGVEKVEGFEFAPPVYDSAPAAVARLAAEGVGAAPTIQGSEEPEHFNDGRQMHVRFRQDPALRYNLYVSRFPDGRGADLLVAGVADHQLVGGLRPEMTMYLFLTSVDVQKRESKPSKAFRLVTHDKFLEK